VSVVDERDDVSAWEGLCLMLVAAVVVRLLFTGQLQEAICCVWSFWLLEARTSIPNAGENC
jgi:hypothetical protein